MHEQKQELPKKQLPRKIERELLKGETIYHSTIRNYVNSKFPEGKWVAEVRRDEKGKIVRYPVKSFGTPREALDYVETTRPKAPGQLLLVRPGESTVRDLYNFANAHKRRKLADSTRDAMSTRWKTYIEPEWGDMPISRVTSRAAQEWITQLEEALEAGAKDVPTHSQLIKVRTECHAIFEVQGQFSSEYAERKNPFADLAFTPLPPRRKITIESQHFGALVHACNFLASNGFVQDWIVEMYITSLLSGLRQGEVMALCADQLIFDKGAILIDRAVRRKSKAIDPLTRKEKGAVLPQAMNLPKGGRESVDKSRLVPMSEQLSTLLSDALSRKPEKRGEWDLMWPSATGEIRDQSHFKSAWKTLRKRLHEVATLAPTDHIGEWPEIPTQRGWKRNSLIEMAREDPKYRLPGIFSEMDFRDTRNSFSSFMNEVGIAQATREEFLGHGGKGITNSIYTSVTTIAFQDARQRLTDGWRTLDQSGETLEQVA